MPRGGADGHGCVGRRRQHATRRAHLHLVHGLHVWLACRLVACGQQLAQAVVMASRRFDGRRLSGDGKAAGLGRRCPRAARRA
eukprot:1850190-Prymnesium_polylepis.1